MKSVPAGEGQAWHVRKVTLNLLSTSPETWYYIVNFTAWPGEMTQWGVNAGVEGFNVIVTMDGKIPGGAEH